MILESKALAFVKFFSLGLSDRKRCSKQGPFPIFLVRATCKFSQVKTLGAIFILRKGKGVGG